MRALIEKRICVARRCPSPGPRCARATLSPLRGAREKTESAACAEFRTEWASRDYARTGSAGCRHSASLRAFTPVFDGLWTRVNGLVPPSELRLLYRAMTRGRRAQQA